MDRNHFSQAATGFVTQFGKAAHQAIGLYRDNGVRIGGMAAERWDVAFAHAKPRLSAETRRNAARTKHVVGRAYNKGLALSADGATAVVDTFVGAAITGIQRATGSRSGPDAA